MEHQKNYSTYIRVSSGGLILNVNVCLKYNIKNSHLWQIIGNYYTKVLTTFASF